MSKEFLPLLSPSTALDTLLQHVSPLKGWEFSNLFNANGRILCKAINATVSLPPFRRSTVDGYAVIAADTFGASDGLPAYLEVVGEIAMGSAELDDIETGRCRLIHTGGMLPPSADAVVMLEHTQIFSTNGIEVFRPIGVGENVIQIGEDVAVGEEVIRAGTELGPAEIGGLAALGFEKIPVFKKPQVAIVSSGDELIPPNQPLPPGKVYDVNTYSLYSFIERLGGNPVSYGILPDDANSFLKVAQTALNETDMVVFTAGSSMSVRDLTAQTIAALGDPGILVHGVNIKPGKPTILAVCGGKPVIGLPGNPVSALVISQVFLHPVLERLSGKAYKSVMPGVIATLTTNYASQAGREDWVPVRLIESRDGYHAQPVFGKSNLIFNLVKADGLVRIAPEVTGLSSGESVYVTLL